jgi:hypothetical protein
MKKKLGWLSVIFSSLFLLLFAIFLIYKIVYLFKGGTDINLEVEIIIPIFFILLLIYWLKNGLKKINKSKRVQIIEYLGKLNIHYTGKLLYKDYLKFYLKTALIKPTYIITVLLLATMYVNSLLYAEQMEDIFSIMGMMFLFGVVLVPILYLMQAKKTYETNQAFHEELTYNLDNECINIKGDTVDSTTKWTRLYKTAETKQFFILYHDAIVANFIDKKLLTDAEIHEFREIIKSLNLRENEK